MAASGSNLNVGIDENKVSAELDENGELTYFQVKSQRFNTKYKKEEEKRIRDKKKFNITGIPQLGVDAPHPYDRGELIDKEFSTKPLLRRGWFSLLVTLGAVILDTICYLQIFEGFTTDTDVDVNVATTLLAAVAAAFSIDVLPAFFAQILHKIVRDKKRVLKNFFIISLVFVILFVIVLFLARSNFFSTRFPRLLANDLILVQALIPIATTLVCFIVNFLSYDPYFKELKILRKVTLAKEEDLNELHAVIQEIDRDADYADRLASLDQNLYNSTSARIDAIGEHYKAFVRISLIPQMHSPADTSDLSV